MPELRRFAPNVPIVLVGTKLGKFCFADFLFWNFSWLIHYVLVLFRSPGWQGIPRGSHQCHYLYSGIYG